jgi:hypothetical protein
MRKPTTKDPQQAHFLLALWAYAPKEGLAGHAFSSSALPASGSVQLKLGGPVHTVVRVVGPHGKPLADARVAPVMVRVAGGVRPRSTFPPPEALADLLAATTDTDGKGEMHGSRRDWKIAGRRRSGTWRRATNWARKTRLDLNDDGHRDSSSEQFQFASILTIADARYAVRSDPLGQRLSFEPLNGGGTVRLALAKRQGLPAAVELTATLIGGDGPAVGSTGEWAEASIPIGEYRLGTVACAIDVVQGGPRWNFDFSDIDRRGEARWYNFEQAGTATIDPIGIFEFKTETERNGPVRPGDDLRVQPQLFTGDGVLIVT